ncbi:hypothetical protein SRHO_G00315690 [Serrasalmus rhombeus]
MDGSSTAAAPTSLPPLVPPFPLTRELLRCPRPRRERNLQTRRVKINTTVCGSTPRPRISKARLKLARTERVTAASQTHAEGVLHSSPNTWL